MQHIMCFLLSLGACLYAQNIRLVVKSFHLEKSRRSSFFTRGTDPRTCASSTEKHHLCLQSSTEEHHLCLQATPKVNSPPQNPHIERYMCIIHRRTSSLLAIIHRRTSSLFASNTEGEYPPQTPPNPPCCYMRIIHRRTSSLFASIHRRTSSLFASNDESDFEFPPIETKAPRSKDILWMQKTNVHGLLLHVPPKTYFVMDLAQKK